MVFLILTSFTSFLYRSLKQAHETEQEKKLKHQKDLKTHVVTGTILADFLGKVVLKLSSFQVDKAI